MPPAPSRIHQKISFNFTGIFYNYFQNKTCDVYSAPFDVRLTTKDKKDNEVITVVRPDLCVICDPEKLDDRGCVGAPDFIIEILSPGNTMKEINIKYDLYEESGVREYWVVRPEYEEILNMSQKMENIHLKPTFAGREKEISPFIFPGLKIIWKDILYFFTM